MITFSQRDPKWKDEILGTGKLSIGQAGCLVTSVAAMLATWGEGINPYQLNEYLKTHHGYVNGNLFVFSAVNNLGAVFVRRINCYSIPAPVKWLKDAINEGLGVIALVDAKPGSKLDQHWVWLMALAENSGHIMDSWQLPGNELTGLGQYLATGWTPARGIFAAAIYKRTDLSLYADVELDITVHQDIVHERAE